MTDPNSNIKIDGPIPKFLGGKFPNIKCETSDSPDFDLYEYKKEKWLVFFSHPKDFTPVCTTEFARAVTLFDEFDKRGVKMLGLSPDPVESHIKWGMDIIDYAKELGCTQETLPFPIVADAKRQLAKELSLLSEEDFEKDGLPESCRACFFVSPDNKLKAQMYYPPQVGRDFNEILRVIDALIVGTKYGVNSPEGWKQGGEFMVAPSLSQEEAEKKFGAENISKVELPSKKEYMRFVKIKD